MKKLTTGIFTVLLGLVAVDANASVTSKAYVDTKVGTEVGAVNTKVTNLTTRVTANEGSITNINSSIEELQAAVGDGEGSLGADIDALQTTVGQHTTAIGVLNGNAEQAGSVAKSIADALDPYSTTTQVEGLIETATTDMETKANASATYATKAALTAEETARTAADNAINTKIGTVPEGKDVVTMISEAKTAATYDNTEVKASITAIENGAVMTSGATKEKIDAIATNTTAISDEVTRAKAAEKANADAIDAIDAAYKEADTTLTTAVNKAQADATQALNESIKKVTATGEDGTYVLTIKTVGDLATLKWENIERAPAATTAD